MGNDGYAAKRFCQSDSVFHRKHDRIEPGKLPPEFADFSCLHELLIEYQDQMPLQGADLKCRINSDAVVVLQVPFADAPPAFFNGCESVSNLVLTGDHMFRKDQEIQSQSRGSMKDVLHRVHAVGESRVTVCFSNFDMGLAYFQLRDIC